MLSTLLSRIPRLKLSLPSLAIIVAVYFATVMNYPVIAKIFQLSQSVPHIWFPYTAPALLFFCFLIIFAILAIPYLFKPLIAFIVLTSASALYAAVNFHTLFDSAMIENVFETNASEASSYLSVTSVLYLLLFGVIPTLFIFWVKVVPQKSWARAAITRAALVLVGVAGILMIAATSYKDYASVGRNNKYLNKMITPAHLYYAVRYLDTTYFTPQLAYKPQGTDAKLLPTQNGKPTLMVVVLGETARAMNFAYNGYERDTNPYTKDLGLISFQHVSSCGTYTALSVPCMFSNLNRDNYNARRAQAQDNALNIIQHAGVDILWVDNDGGDKGVAKKLPYVAIDGKLRDQQCNGTTCFDAVMLNQAKQFIAKDNNSKLLVLHTIGSHGPTYWQRYPNQDGLFTPACNRADIEKCSDKEITNVYDNTLVYTDYVLAKVVDELKSYSDQYNVAMMYISDHGESLGEKGLYLHGTPYAIAPTEQTHVPWLMWLPNQYAQQKGLDTQCIGQEASRNQYSHDNLFHSLIGFYGVETSVKDNAMDVTQNCRLTVNSKSEVIAKVN